MVEREFRANVISSFVQKRTAVVGQIFQIWGQETKEMDVKFW